MKDADSSEGIGKAEECDMKVLRGDEGAFERGGKLTGTDLYENDGGIRYGIVKTVQDDTFA